VWLSSHDLTIWQRLLQFGDARVRDLGMENLQVQELLQAPQEQEAFVRYRGVVQPEPLQLCQVAEIPQPSVGNLRAAEVQFFESGESAKMLQSSVAHRGVAKPKPLQLCQSLKVFQSSIRDRGFVKQKSLQLR